MVENKLEDTVLLAFPMLANVLSLSLIITSGCTLLTFTKRNKTAIKSKYHDRYKSKINRIPWITIFMENIDSFLEMLFV